MIGLSQKNKRMSVIGLSQWGNKQKKLNHFVTLNSSLTLSCAST